jgi:uncharacterized protein (TIGR02001 family)
MFSALAIVLFSTATATAGVSYNAGWASEYHFRGVFQKSSSASAGVDFDENGFYAGAWTADVGDGLEYDLYFGYGIETEDGLSASVGYTAYLYTGEFDDTYKEVNFNAGYGALGIEYSFGEWEGFGSPSDYDFLALSVDLGKGFSGTYGTFGDEADGDYIEIAYGTTISDLDVGLSLIFSSEELGDQTDASGNDDSSQAIVFTIGKSW